MLAPIDRACALAFLSLCACGRIGFDLSDADDAGTAIDARRSSLAPALARYWINEAAAMQGVPEIIDDTPNPVHLTLQYDPSNPVFGEGGGGGRYIRFAGTGDVGSLMPIAGTKFAALHGATKATIEIKFQVDACDAATEQQRIFGFGDGPDTSNGWLTARAWRPNGVSSVGLALAWAGRDSWVFFYTAGCPDTVGVTHWIVDTGEPLPQDRVRIYRDGMRLAVSSYGGGDPGVWPPLDAQIDLGPMTQTVNLARATDGARRTGERIYYVAVYQEALSVEQVEQHSAELLAEDD